ncbi:hypothetical protein H5410_045238 [Solanum commersonii]|uniref:Uncharacterized protein n=1 Tax=Solanum commersonii TaxID=4109 RepID=A0A9J5XC65_SOLCO|nr:hypothetical protein H5410_045238 [Solanum commersonii]
MGRGRPRRDTQKHRDEENRQKPWANLFATNRMAAKGMNLTYIPPVIIEGEKIVEILAEDVAKDDEK